MHRVYTIMFWVSILMATTAVVVTLIFGLKLGVDFGGGSVLELEFAN